MNEATLCAMHQTLAGRGGSFRGETLHDSGLGVVRGRSLLMASRVRRGKVVSSLPSRPRDCWGGLLGRKGSSWCLCRYEH
ncbi:hypothetical protein E2C01_064774 [Portunus trituberculatus]|uniref:Uncharacterized protein n=1 Tax=Portunus trituberculatus TaxID=210409 RepID=A0A5B7HK22_PORTR|nr:hypothetical protein [Portunus trituberculatus]